MKSSLFFCVLSLLVLPISLLSQRCPGSTPYWGLNCFLGSEFMNKFEEARDNSEQSIRDFQALHQRYKYSETDYQTVIDAYNASANEFNLVLESIKEDMLDKQTRKQITGNPQSYALIVDERLNRAKQFYANHYLAEVSRVTEGRITGSSFLAALPTIIKFTEQAFLLYGKIKSEIKKYNNELLSDKLVAQNSFKSFQQIR
jgi:hypothetical protein